jgi:hypothetical protein
MSDRTQGLAVLTSDDGAVVPRGGRGYRLTILTSDRGSFGLLPRVEVPGG